MSEELKPGIDGQSFRIKLNKSWFDHGDVLIPVKKKKRPEPILIRKRINYIKVQTRLTTQWSKFKFKKHIGIWQQLSDTSRAAIKVTDRSASLIKENVDSINVDSWVSRQQVIALEKLKSDYNKFVQPLVDRGVI